MTQQLVGLGGAGEGARSGRVEDLPLEGGADAVRNERRAAADADHRRAGVHGGPTQGQWAAQWAECAGSGESQDPTIVGEPGRPQRGGEFGGADPVGVDDMVGHVIGDDPLGAQMRVDAMDHCMIQGGGQANGGEYGHLATVPVDSLAAMETVVDLSGVTVRRGTATLVDNVDWRIDAADRWVVIGPNGAGKTTLLQVLAAQIHPTDGIAEILGEIMGIVDVFELRPRIGVTSAALADRIPKRERVADAVVSAAYAVTGRWKEEYDELDHERAVELLTSLGVEHLADRTFGTLSEGEKKRVQIARALMTDPELLLLDEPAAGLDLAGRELLVRSLAQLAADEFSPAMVMITHHVEEIPPGMTHVLLMSEGRVVAAGPLEETLTAANMSATFGLPLELERRGGRWTARAVG